MSRSISKNINNSDKQQRETGGNGAVGRGVGEREEQGGTNKSVAPGRETETARATHCKREEDENGERKSARIW